MELSSIHILFIIVGTIALIFSLIVVLTKKGKFLYKHKVLSTIALILINLSILNIYLSNRRINLNFSHGIFGFLFFVLSIINLILGVIYTGKIDVSLKKRLRQIHIWIGRVLFIIFILNIIFGYITFKPF